MINPVILTNAVIAAIIAILSGGIGFNIGIHYERSGWQQKEIQRKEAEKALILQHQQEIDNLLKQQNEKDRRSVKEKDDAIKKLKFDYDRSRTTGLRVTASICNGITGQAIAASSKGTDGAATGTVKLPQAITDDLFKLAERADTIVEQYRALEHWITYQGLYKDE